jgi:hypothetical protein
MMRIRNSVLWVIILNSAHVWPLHWCMCCLYVGFDVRQRQAWLEMPSDMLCIGLESLGPIGPDPRLRLAIDLESWSKWEKETILQCRHEKFNLELVVEGGGCNVADPDPGSGASFAPGPGSMIIFFCEFRTRIADPTQRLRTKFGVKNTWILCQFTQIFLCICSENFIIYIQCSGWDC